MAEHRDDLAEVLVREDYIVEVRLNCREYSRPLVEQVIARIKKLTNNQNLLILVLASQNSRISLDGIKSLFSREAVSYPMGKAYVIHKKSHFILAGICLWLFKPVTPIRFFQNAPEAEIWLKSLISCEI